MVKVFDELKHLLEEGEEMLLSIFDNGNYHVLAYNKVYNLLFYFQAMKLGFDGKYQRTFEEIVSPSTLKDKLGHLLAPEALEFLEKNLQEKYTYAD
ncbi:hypothetical protein HY04AAS1_0701 [Hydrogenobaculum sp. Y04AAS1]|uniref:hypothetical protein n=1 Tax=Hydrogenobaculum sp. (strain Y04AAS1) TaxID=380749 RepID=UPI00015BCDEA|nr:hypothetical protein HY04AAS1_0701 [Hydrogenobaculum sp. Y04AAS1]HCT65928.1 hypothetical protein [Hydrogenobaculum sp.]